MIVREHQNLKFGLSKDQKIFRYIGLDKLISCFNTGSLFFASISTMIDKYEGKITNATKENWLSNSGDKRSTVEYNISTIEEFIRQHINILCWNINESEDELLWSKFCHNELSICIESSIDRLFNAFRETTDDVFIAEINYIDFQSIVKDEMNVFSIVVNKNPFYRNENELRLICMTPRTGVGQTVKVNYRELINRIILSPNASEWTIDVMTDIIHKYDPEVVVEKSMIHYW